MTNRGLSSHYQELSLKLHHAGLTSGHGRSLFLRLIYDEALRCEEHACDRSGVLQSHTLYLGRVDDTSLTQVLELILTGIVTEVTLALTYLVNNHGALAASIGNNLTQRLLNGTANDIDTCLLISVVALQAFQLFLSADIGSTATDDDTFLCSRTCSAESVINTVLLLLHLNL